MNDIPSIKPTVPESSYLRKPASLAHLYQKPLPPPPASEVIDADGTGGDGTETDGDPGEVVDDADRDSPDAELVLDSGTDEQPIDELVVLFIILI